MQVQPVRLGHNRGWIMNHKELLKPKAVNPWAGRLKHFGNTLIGATVTGLFKPDLDLAPSNACTLPIVSSIGRVKCSPAARFGKVRTIRPSSSLDFE